MTCKHVIMQTLGPTPRIKGLNMAAMGDSLQDRARRAILSNIENGTYEPGERLPAEKELAAQLGVSLAPVRGALDQLAQQGTVIRRQGSGTYVSEPSVQYRLESWQSCTDDLKNQGIEFSTRVLACGIDMPAAEVAAALGLNPDASCFHLVRLIYVHEKPGILLDSWTRDIDASVFGDGEVFEDGRSLYGELAAQGAPIVSADTSIQICITDELESSIFDLPFASPLLQVTGIAYSYRGPTEWSRLRYNAPIFSLNMHHDFEQGHK
jgi:GntR family transcriptional regulator